MAVNNRGLVVCIIDCAKCLSLPWFHFYYLRTSTKLGRHEQRVIL